MGCNGLGTLWNTPHEQLIFCWDFVPFSVCVVAVGMLFHMRHAAHYITTVLFFSFVLIQFGVQYKLRYTYCMYCSTVPMYFVLEGTSTVVYK